MPNDTTDKSDNKTVPSDAQKSEPTSAPLPEALKQSPSGDIIEKVAEKINSCDNILVALSKDPSVDEISAAIGLTMILNQAGKHVTAIYSGVTPNTLEFLKPDETFEKDTHSLQDFIIALNKDKADHLRYKIEGDFVKVYITPYKTTISQNDLEFSQGDFNVDLVIAIDVDSGGSIDNALAEYGRIMHDATAINITTNASGHFAELEWSDPSISSVCEMVAKLAEKIGINEFDQSTATALLTGIVAATERFSNARTTSDTMALSSKLMQSGADQQLISNNIMAQINAGVPAAQAAPAVPAEPMAPVPATPAMPVALTAAPGPLIPEPSLATPVPEMPAMPAAPVAPTEPAAPAAPTMPAAPTPAPTLLEQAQMAPEPVAPTAPAPTMPEPIAPAPAAEPEILVGTPAPTAPRPAPSLEPAGPEGLATPTSPIETEPIQKTAPAPTAPAPDTMALPGYASADDVQAAMNAILNPGEGTPAPASNTVEMPKIVSQGFVMSQNVAEPVEQPPDYGAMIDQALSEGSRPLANPAVAAAPAVPGQAPEAANIPDVYTDPNTSVATPAPEMPPVPQDPNMAPMAGFPQDPGMPPVPQIPEVPAQPVDVPADMNIELPPPPAPDVDTSAFQIPQA